MTSVRFTGLREGEVVSLLPAENKTVFFKDGDEVGL